MISGNLVFTRGSVIAWFKVPDTSWSFLGEDQRLAIVFGQASRLAGLVGRRVHMRVTSRPFDTSRWARSLDNSTRGPFDQYGRPAHQALPGACAVHPDRSEDGCPTCVPGTAWLDWLQQQQRHMRGNWGLSQRDVYLGVEVSARNDLRRLVANAWDKAGAAEVESQYTQAEEVTAALQGGYLNAHPCTPREMQWLFLRSTGLLMPAPMPVTDVPMPVPYAMPATTPHTVAQDGLGVYTDGFAWTAQPFDHTVQITRSDGATSHVAVMTFDSMINPVNLASDSPWIQRTDKLGFPVEVSITFDVLEPRAIAQQMKKQAARMRAQAQHIQAHGEPLPPDMQVQLEMAERIQAQAERGDQAASHVFAWIRLAVGGGSQRETMARVREVTRAYAPTLTVIKPKGQYGLAREFIPGEPLSSPAFRHLLSLELLTAGMPAASARVGHAHGFPVGWTTSLALRPVTFHPFYGMERAQNPGLSVGIGKPGSGKSAFGGLMAYMSARAGYRTLVLDPSGMMHRLCELPELASHSRAINLLDSPDGTLSPFRLVRAPARTEFAYDERGQRIPEHIAEERWRKACQSAEIERRQTVVDMLSLLLPFGPGDRDERHALGEAVRRTPADVGTSPFEVIKALRDLEDTLGLGSTPRFVANELEEIAGHPLARLFFPSGAEAEHTDEIASQVLTVMTLQGLRVPGPDRRPDQRTREEQLSAAIAQLAARLLHRMITSLPRHDRKMALLDEAQALASDPVGQQTLKGISRDSRKWNLFTFALTQIPADLLEMALANLIGTVFAFHMDGQPEQEDACRLLGLPVGHGYEKILGALSSRALNGSGETGECVMADGLGGLERVQIDLGPNPDLRAALNSTPGEYSADSYEDSP